MSFTLRQIQVFVTVAELQHFGDAATRLGITQPTLSGDVRALEKALGTTLFDRSPRGTRITGAGRTLRPFAEAVLAAAEDLDAHARNLRSPQTRRITVAATPSMVNSLVPRVLQHVMESGRGGSVEIAEVDTGGALPALTSGVASVAVGHFLHPPAGGGVTTIGHDDMWLVSAPGVLPASGWAGFEAVRGKSLLMFGREQNPSYFDAVVEAVRERGFDGEITNSPVRLSGSYSFLLTSGVAFAVVPEAYARTTTQSLSIAPLQPRLSIPVDVAWSGARTESVDAVVRVFSEVHRRAEEGDPTPVRGDTRDRRSHRSNRDGEG